MRRRYSERDVLLAAPVGDSWLTVLAIDPAANWLTRRLAEERLVTPSQVTAAGGVLTVIATGAFLAGGRLLTLAAALAFYLAFVLDRVDGRLARLTRRVTRTGTWLADVLGQARFLLCAPAVIIGARERELLPLAVLVVLCALACRAASPGRPVALSHLPLPPRQRIGRQPVTEAEVSLVVCLLAPQTGWYLPLVTGGCAAWLACTGEAVLSDRAVAG